MDNSIYNSPEDFNIADWLINHNLTAGRGEKIALFYNEQKFTYNELNSLVNRAGSLFLGLGVEMENRVMLLLLDTPAFVASFLGAMRIGAVPIPVSTMLRSHDYQYLLHDSRAKVLVVDEPLLSEVEPVLAGLRCLKDIIVVGKPKKGQHSFYELIERASDRLDAPQTRRDDQAFWLYSSGSTGFPKGTVHLQHDIVFCIEAYARGVLGMTEEDRTFSAAKLFFAYGLGNNLYFPMGVGASMVLYDGRPVADKMFEVIDRYKPTLFFGVPTLYASMLQIEDAPRKYDLSSLRLCISAGEALPEDFYHRWKKRFGLEILDGIGTTEICHIFISNRPGEARPGSTGKLVPGYDAKVLDEAGKEVGPGEIGNLLVRGDSIAAMYWNKHERTKSTFLGDWITTGDKYYRDQDGYFWYCGRSDDMLKVGGIWVSPVEVENTLVAHPAVLECAVVGSTDQNGLMKPKAFVVLKQGYEAVPGLEGELKEFVKGRIAPYKYPRWIEFVSDLPKTATGKMQRFKLRQQAR